MQEQDKLREIAELGMEEGGEAFPPPEEPEKSPSLVPLLQGAACLLVLAGLLLLRVVDPPRYEAFSQWYQQEASAEIELPQWGEEATVSPSPQPSPSPSPQQPWDETEPLQRV